MNGMFWFQLVVIVALLAAVGWLAVGGGGHMSEPVQDRPDLALPPEGLLDRRDVDRVRFSVGARGYRMDEVDDVLDRLAHEIDVRERRIAVLEGREPDEELDERGADHAIANPESGADEDADADEHADGPRESAQEPAAESGADEIVGSADSRTTRSSDSGAAGDA